MNTFTEMQEELLSRLMVANNSTLYTSTRLAKLIKDAYIWVTDMYLWPQMERAKYTSTVSSQYYYDYPETFKTDCVTRILVDADEYDRVAFEDFLDYKDKYPTAIDTKIFADFSRQIFLFPTPTSVVTLTAWGIIQPEPLSSGTDTTIFSNSDENANEAIVKKALSVALARSNKKEAVQEETEARVILATVYNKILQRHQRDQRLDHEHFDVPDFFGNTRVSDVGKFNY